MRALAQLSHVKTESRSSKEHEHEQICFNVDGSNLHQIRSIYRSCAKEKAFVSASLDPFLDSHNHISRQT